MVTPITAPVQNVHVVQELLPAWAGIRLEPLLQFWHLEELIEPGLRDRTETEHLLQSFRTQQAAATQRSAPFSQQCIITAHSTGAAAEMQCVPA